MDTVWSYHRDLSPQIVYETSELPRGNSGSSWEFGTAAIDEGMGR